MKIGVSKKEITTYNKGKGMLGYGMHFHVTETKHSPLYARAIVFKNGIAKTVFVNVELCFITTSLKDKVVQLLNKKVPESNWNNANVILTAQHTHSGPAGFSQHIFYNILVPGFQQNIHDFIANKIVEGIVEADKNTQECAIFYDESEFEESIPVAFNRSLDSYNKNKEIENFFTFNETHKAVDRTMRLMYFKNESEEIFASLNWFGVHTTSVSNDKNAICYDNKGYAAEHLEQQFDYNHIAVFAQEIAGDITPNYVWDNEKNWTRGKYKDDYKSAEFNGKLQAQKAQEIIQSKTSINISGEIKSIHQFVDFSEVECSPKFTNNQNGCKTVPASIGVSMLEGTVEGPGMEKIIGNISRFASRMVKFYELNILSKFLKDKERLKAIKDKYHYQGKKDIIMELGLGRILGTSEISKFILPSFVDPTIKSFKDIGSLGELNQTPWCPHILPLQLTQIGTLAIVSVPSEITTIAGQRVRKLIEKKLESIGIKKVIVASYANAYAGYITTNEEYQEQAYEAGHTVFGEWTLAAYLTKFEELCDSFIQGEKDEIGELNAKILPDELIWKGN